MTLLAETMPHIVGGLAVAALLGLLSWVVGRVRPFERKASAAAATPATIPALPQTVATLRTYTLLGTKDPNDRPVQRASTRPVGSIVIIAVDGRPERYELTNVPLHDGTFAAEPIDRLL